MVPNVAGVHWVALAAQLELLVVNHLARKRHSLGQWSGLRAPARTGTDSTDLDVRCSDRPRQRNLLDRDDASYLSRPHIGDLSGGGARRAGVPEASP